LKGAASEYLFFAAPPAAVTTPPGRAAIFLLRFGVFLRMLRTFTV
jgi:hypothetical protein